MQIRTLFKFSVFALVFFFLTALLFMAGTINEIRYLGNTIRSLSAQALLSEQLLRAVYTAPGNGDARALIEKIEGFIKDLTTAGNGLRGKKSIAKVDEIKDQWERYKSAIGNANSIGIEDHKNEILGEVNREGERFLSLVTEATSDLVFTLDSRLRFLKNFLSVFFVSGLFVLAAVWLLGNRVLLRPLSKLQEDVKQISEGNLSINVDQGRRDEMGLLSSNLSRAIHSLGNMINNVVQGIQNTILAAELTMTKVAEASCGAKVQSSQLSQIAASTEEMSQTITEIARNTSFAAESSKKAMEAAGEGKRVAGEAIGIVNRVYNSAFDVATMVEKLNKRVNEIGDIVTVIKDIADQTNLLALNAAIEAARAGEQGRGFAVVADEVRKLAERTIKATLEISETIKAVQVDSDETKRSVENSFNEVTKAVECIKQVGESLNQMVDSIERASDQTTRIATAVEEQSVASEEVAKNVEEAAVIARNIENMAEDIRVAMKNLVGMARELNKQVEGFRVKTDEDVLLSLAEIEHRIWQNRVISSVKGLATQGVSVAQLRDHRGCKLGKWYYEEGKSIYGNVPAFKALEEPHRRLHSLQREALLAYNGGDKKKTEDFCRSMEEALNQFVSLIGELRKQIGIRLRNENVM
ncbi:Methyl-accepting chemotaxis protein McpQ [bacterium HR37]|nr:Methyl-accepting chemotaxis protein McpQ [bacterium HR37]